MADSRKHRIRVQGYRFSRGGEAMSRILSSRAGLVIARGLTIGLAFACSIGIMTAQNAANTLTAAEKAEGWKLLFDGKTLNGWRGFKSETPPAGWHAMNGELVRHGTGGDLMTGEQFGDF